METTSTTVIFIGLFFGKMVNGHNSTMFFRKAAPIGVTKPLKR
jgi:hypothetical protein